MYNDPMPCPVHPGDLLELAGETATDPLSAPGVVRAVYENLRELWAACVHPEPWDERAEQLASAMGAIGVVVGMPDFPDVPMFRMALLYWPEGHWTDLRGNPMTVKVTSSGLFA
jgi:hypothetical protein